MMARMASPDPGASHDPVSPLAAVSWPVLTERLSLRPATPDDVATTWVFRRLPEVTEWMTAAPETQEEYAARFLPEDRLGKTLVIELDGRVVGDLMLAVEDAWAQLEVADRARGVQAEIGYCLDPAFQGHGYAREAVAALLRLCFVDLGLRRVTANCFADNEPSWRLMERLGMRRELHTRRESLHRSQGWLDGLGYALLAEEWRAEQP
jgi:RimJ/RimL family protein N-acetyltransferase